MAAALPHASEVFDLERTDQVSRLSMKVFGREPERVAFPGGNSRAAFVADMGDALYVFARREDEGDAQREGIVLKALSGKGLVPQLKAVVDDWLVQEFIDGVRLPVVLDTTESMAEKTELVSRSIAALAEIHEAARDINLQHRVPKGGVTENWLWDRTGAAKRISLSLDIDPPELDRHKLVEMMEVKRQDFIKWDARPGNAMVGEDRVIWFDWEDCVRGVALEDLAFVLFDEWTMLDRESEALLIDRHIGAFMGRMSHDRAMEYLLTFGVTHMMLRLRMAVKLKLRKETWWDREHCLNLDKVGTTPEECGRTISRARHWADEVPQWRPLIPWLEDAADALEL